VLASEQRAGEASDDPLAHEAASGAHDRRALAHELRADDLASSGRDREAIREWDKAVDERMLAQRERELAEHARAARHRRKVP
jgi:predicted negative regulator of RcsB-dependent stress response